MHVGVEVDDPILQCRNAADHLRAHGAAVKGSFKREDADLLVSAFAATVSPGQLQGAFGGLGTRGKQKAFIQSCGGNLDELLHQTGTPLGGKAVVMEQTFFCLLDDGVHDFRMAVADVGDQHARAPVQPLIAVAVVDLESFGAVPDNRRLAAHGARLVAG